MPRAVKARFVEPMLPFKVDELPERVAECRNGRYEPGLRSGLWRKMRVNQAQDFVIGGYSKGAPFDALICGYHNDQGESKFQELEISHCPFVNLPQRRPGR
jgi:bifunctional non-homologous end joining protein LigD